MPPFLQNYYNIAKVLIRCKKCPANSAKLQQKTVFQQNNVKFSLLQVCSGWMLGVVQSGTFDQKITSYTSLETVQHTLEVSFNTKNTKTKNMEHLNCLLRPPHSQAIETKQWHFHFFGGMVSLIRTGGQVLQHSYPWTQNGCHRPFPVPPRPFPVLRWRPFRVRGELLQSTWQS